MSPTARPPSGSRRHLDLRRVLDFLEDRLAPSVARQVEEHLASPCPACRERVREAATLIDLMQRDRSAPVPAALRARALEVFVPRPARPRRESLAARLAVLLFDSLATPMPAATRRAVGEARLLRWGIGSGTLEIEIEREGPGEASMRGRLLLEDAALHRIVVAVGPERRETWPDAAGRFVLERVSPGRVTLEVSGLAGRFRLPPFEI